MERLSETVTRAVGSSAAFLVALGIVVLWLVLGPVFGFSDTWQLVINTATTIITFLMVFLIQRTQNKDSRAIALKLNELIAATQGASNRLISLEDLSEQELETLHRHYGRLVRMARHDASLLESHSVEEAAVRHGLKSRGKTTGRKATERKA
jgi:low affinity Fe/Cu permease